MEPNILGVNHSVNLSYICCVECWYNMTWNLIYLVSNTQWISIIYVVLNVDIIWHGTLYTWCRTLCESLLYMLCWMLILYDRFWLLYFFIDKMKYATISISIFTKRNVILIKCQFFYKSPICIFLYNSVHFFLFFSSLLKLLNVCSASISCFSSIVLLDVIWIYGVLRYLSSIAILTTTRDQTTHLALVHRPMPYIIDLSHTTTYHSRTPTLWVNDF